MRSPRSFVIDKKARLTKALGALVKQMKKVCKVCKNNPALSSRKSGRMI
jgi:hypothetical protein